MGKHCFPNLPPHKNAPLSAAVESDVVGYTTVELTTKFTLVALNFSSLEGNETIPVNEVISGDFVNGDQLQIQDTEGGYTILYWKNNNGWYGAGTDTIPATLEVARGTGMWVVSQTASEETPLTVQLAGAVNLTDTLNITDFGNRYLIASSGLPVNTTVNGNLFVWENMTDGDQLQLPDGEGGYTILQWRDGHWYGAGAGNNNPPATLVIPKESGFWLYASNPAAKLKVLPTNLSSN